MANLTPSPFSSMTKQNQYFVLISRFELILVAFHLDSQYEVERY